MCFNMYRHLNYYNNVSKSFKLCRNLSNSCGVNLKDKVAIITASTEGIGLAAAEYIGKLGATVVISSRKKDNVDKALKYLASSNISVFGNVCHVGKVEDCKNLISETVRKFGKLDILVSNAGVNPVYGPMIDVNEEAWDKIFDINVKSAFFMAKEAISHMKQSGGGSVIFVSSVAAYSPMKNLGVYGVSKCALLGLTKQLAFDCASSSIRVNCVAPGIVKTKMSTALLKQELLESIPLRRFAEPSDIAGAIAFLASDASSYVTGETIVVGGGYHSHL